MLAEKVILLYHLLRTRYGLRFQSRQALLRWQSRQLNAFLANRLCGSAFYQAYARPGMQLSDVPVVEKRDMLAHFSEMNVAGISLDAALAVANNAEKTRNFSPKIRDISVGLSSGTQGTPGVFLASDSERATWAGIMVARALQTRLWGQLCKPWAAKIKVAFFLRANSNLYQSLDSSRIAFVFYDLFQGVETHLPALQHQQPDILVAPAQVLAWIAHAVHTGQLSINPRQVISVAEVLEPDDRQAIAQAFGHAPDQLYQCTEGFIAHTCARGVLHLNEEFVHVEPEWLDAEQRRFVPIITDFTRKTQLVVRYRLNDVLQLRDQHCDCGHQGLSLECIEGRSDDILWWQRSTGDGLGALFGDQLRHALLLEDLNSDYRLVQVGDVLQVALDVPSEQGFQQVHQALSRLAQRLQLKLPTLQSIPFVQGGWETKRRRIVCQERPSLTDI